MSLVSGEYLLLHPMNQGSPPQNPWGLPALVETTRPHYREPGGGVRNGVLEGAGGRKHLAALKLQTYVALTIPTKG